MTGRPYGGFWRRYFAFLIDKIILYLVSLFLFAIGMTALGLGSGISPGRILATGELPRGTGLFAAIFTVATVVTDMVYYTWFHGSVGQTPGKMFLGLRVIQASGEHMTFGVAFLRWVGSLVSGLFLWLGYLWIAFDGRKQGWHDKIAATLVVRTGYGPDFHDSPDATVHPPPGPPPVMQDSVVAGSAGPLPPPTTHVSADAGAAVASPPAAPVSDIDSPPVTPPAPAVQADREATDPAGGAQGDLSDRG